MSTKESQLVVWLKLPSAYQAKPYDLRTLLTPALCALREPEAAGSIRASGLPAQICPHRLAMVRGLHAHCDDRLVHGLTHGTVHSNILTFRRFMRFVDEHMANFTPNDAAEALRRYNNYWKNLLNTNQASQHTASSHVLTTSRILASAFGIHWEELRLQVDLISQARYNPPSDNNNAAIQGFMLDMGDIIGAVSLLALKSTDTIEVTFKARGDHQEQTVRLSRHGIPPSSKLPYLHIQAVQLRIAAEYKRFVAITGMNPSVVQRLSITDISLTSSAQRLKAAQFKVRAGKMVRAEIPPNYALLLKKYIEFLKSLPSWGDNQPRLFPGLVVDQESKSDPIVRWKDAGDIRHGRLGRLMDKVGRPTFNGRELRRNKGVYVLRKTGGDALVASRLLNNTPSVAARNYGGQGNRAENEVELTAYFQREIHASQRRLSKSTDPGACAEPKAPSVRPGAPAFVSPQCGAANSCFFCSKYRAIDTPQYMHEIITLRYKLRMREGGSMHNEQTIMTLKRINQIISEYARLSDRHAKEAEHLSDMVSRGRFAELHQNAIELEEILEQ